MGVGSVISFPVGSGAKLHPLTVFSAMKHFLVSHFQSPHTDKKQ